MNDIAVGLDGSPGSVDALRWAAGLAQASSAKVRTVTTWQMPLSATLPMLSGALPSQAFMATECATRVDKALAEAGLDLVSDRAIQEGDSGPVLAGETEVADLVVVGRTGTGRRHGLARVAELVLGSTARHCLHAASGPVAAVPAGSVWSSNAQVVVGIDGSSSSHAALAWAVENLPETSKIHAIRAVRPYVEGLLAFDTDVLDRVLAAAEEELQHSVGVALQDTDEATRRRVETVVVVEHPRYALIDPGFQVDVVVVGKRGTGPIARLLGSISEYAVRHAACPVVVVPDH